MTIKLLIVEDDAQLGLLIEFLFLSYPDIDLHLAKSEFEAMTLMDQYTMDAVITDMQLNSHQGGRSVLKMAVDYDLPVAVMTADVSVPDEEYLDLGAAWIIRKPFDTSILPQIALRLASLND
ncbi:MAG: hypothetical protein RL740_228 [Actinomycetota bacterium]|jgi:DNA-binding response OmpR family regulator